MHTQKVALCIAGQMRTWKECYKYQKNNIIEPLKPDIFVHTERRSGITHKADNKFKQTVNHTDITGEMIEQLYDPIYYEITQSFTEEMRKKYQGVELPNKLREEVPVQSAGNIPNFYGINKCNELKKMYENKNNFKYDIVIRMRPDLMINSRIPDKVFQNTNFLYHSHPHENKISDKFAISNSKNMDYYANLWSKLPEYWKKPLGDGNPQNYRVGERLVRYHMENSTVSTEWIEMDVNVLRRQEFLERKLSDQRIVTQENVFKAFKNPRMALKYISAYIRNHF
jgi:hypothetical protein